MTAYIGKSECYAVYFEFIVDYGLVVDTRVTSGVGFTFTGEAAIRATYTWESFANGASEAVYTTRIVTKFAIVTVARVQVTIRTTFAIIFGIVTCRAIRHFMEFAQI